MSWCRITEVQTLVMVRVLFKTRSVLIKQLFYVTAIKVNYWCEWCVLLCERNRNSLFVYGQPKLIPGNSVVDETGVFFFFFFFFLFVIQEMNLLCSEIICYWMLIWKKIQHQKLLHLFKNILDNILPGKWDWLLIGTNYVRSQ